jgi:hypothetical protein
VRHFASPAFWDSFKRLPPSVQTLAKRNFELLKNDSRHASLHLKQIGRLWSARVGLGHRALGVGSNGDIVWFWIGSHGEYDRLLKKQR